MHSVGNGHPATDGELFSELVEAEDFKKAAEELKTNGVQTGNVPQGIPNGTVKAGPAPNNGPNQRVPGQNQRVYNNAYQKARSPNPPAIGTGRPGSKAMTGSLPIKKSLNVHDTEAFPSLGPARSAKNKRGLHHDPPMDEYSEISGEKAKKVLEEVQRKKVDAQMESTATGAAESVLGDD